MQLSILQVQPVRGKVFDLFLSSLLRSECLANISDLHSQCFYTLGPSIPDLVFRYPRTSMTCCADVVAHEK